MKILVLWVLLTMIMQEIKMIEGTLLAMFLCLEQVLFLGCFLSKKQPIVTLSNTEAKFVAFIACACQAIWLRRILEEL